MIETTSDSAATPLLKDCGAPLKDKPRVVNGSREQRQAEFRRRMERYNRWETSVKLAVLVLGAAFLCTSIALHVMAANTFVWFEPGIIRTEAATITISDQKIAQKIAAVVRASAAEEDAKRRQRATDGNVKKLSMEDGKASPKEE